MVNHEEIKLTLFADNMTCFLRDATSYHRLMETLQVFSRFYNLQVNNDKTQMFADFIKEINSLIYGFIWKGNDKIKRAALINDIENGGLRMLDIQSMIHSQRVMVLKKYADKEHISSWKTILEFFPFRVGRDFILKCNFDTRKFPVYLPAFYKECLDAWTLLNESPMVRTAMLSIRSFGIISL